jgi:hypothetical protein
VIKRQVYYYDLRVSHDAGKNILLKRIRGLFRYRRKLYQLLLMRGREDTLSFYYYYQYWVQQQPYVRVRYLFQFNLVQHGARPKINQTIHKFSKNE